MVPFYIATAGLCVLVKKKETRIEKRARNNEKSFFYMKTLKIDGKKSFYQVWYILVDKQLRKSKII